MASSTQAAPQGAAEPNARRRFVVAVVVLLVIVAAFLLGWLPKHERNRQVAARAHAAQTALPVVEVVQARQQSAEQDLVLPGTVTPLKAAHIYARASGFFKASYADLGDHVRKGQLLGLISAPDLDATVAQSDALLQQTATGVATAEANVHLQQATYDRVHTLVGHGILSQQDDDAARTALEAAQAGLLASHKAVDGAQSALVRSRVLADFEQVRSPIDGTVTARNVETGNLVTPAGAAQGQPPAPGTGPTGGPGTGGAQGGELFYVVDLRSLVVFITVPEANASALKTGQPVQMSFSELPGQTFQGKITHTSDSLDQQTRTLLAEAQVTDPDHRLKPGMFAKTSIRYKAPEPGILVPGDSLITLARGQFVPVVENGVIQMRPVAVGRDLGTQVYVTQGLREGDLMVVNPSDEVQQGARVTARPAPAGQQGNEAKPGDTAKSSK